MISRSWWASNLYQKLIKVVSHGSFVDPLLFVIYFYYIISSSQIGMYIYMQMTQCFTVLLILHWNLPNRSLVTNCFAFIMFSVQFVLFSFWRLKFSSLKWFSKLVHMKVLFQGQTTVVFRGVSVWVFVLFGTPSILKADRTHKIEVAQSTLTVKFNKNDYRSSLMSF